MTTTEQTGMSWLRSRAPGFAGLSRAEVAAVADFALLWTLFEARILNARGSVQRICEAVAAWERSGTLDAPSYDAELAYFRDRYFSEGRFTHHFDGLQLRGNDKPDLVRAVIEGSDCDPNSCVSAVLIIVYRFRNNLFHGVKWQYQLAGQFDNFTHANGVLMRALDQHGDLSSG